MKKALAIVAAIVSIGFLVLGLLFMIAAASVPSRLWVGLALLAVGGGLLWYGLATLRRLTRTSPTVLKPAAVQLARRLGGELTVSQLRAEHRISLELAQRVIDELAQEGACTLEQRGQRQVYVFKGLMPATAAKVCPYCGTEMPVRSALRKCPNCGAQLEITKS